MPLSRSAASASCEAEAERTVSTEAVRLFTETRVTFTAFSVLVTVAFRSVNSFCTSSSGTASATLLTSVITDSRLSMVSFSPCRLFLASSMSLTSDSAVASSPRAGITAPITLLTTSAMVLISKATLRSSPAMPGWQFRGARLVGLTKWTLPRPPLPPCATMNS